MKIKVFYSEHESEFASTMYVVSLQFTQAVRFQLRTENKKKVKKFLKSLETAEFVRMKDKTTKMHGVKKKGE